MNENNVAVLTVGCDDYVDILELSLYYKDKYWDHSCQWPYLLATQSVKPKREGFDRVVFAGKDSQWTDRLKKALEEINEEYIILLLDDFYWEENIDSEMIYAMIQYMKENNVGSLNFAKCGQERSSIGYTEVKQGEPFRISITPSIWKKEYLEMINYDGINVFSAERVFSENSNEHDEKVVRCSQIKMVHAIRQGTWTKDAYRSFKENKVPISLYKNRGKRPWADLKF